MSGNLSSNFEFLKEHDPVFLEIAISAERAFVSDPNTTLIKLRQLGEAMAQDIAARCGIVFDEETSQADLLYKINREINLDPNIRNLFHILRIEGNKATHQFRTQHKEALEGLKVARTLAVLFHQAFGSKGASFKPGPFIKPSDPSENLRDLQAEISKLTTELNEKDVQLESNQQLADLLKKEKEEYETLAEHMDEEARTFEKIAQEHEEALSKQKAEFDKRLKELQSKLENQQDLNTIERKVKKASSLVYLSEELTRVIIDQKLIDAGWETDTQELTYNQGSRPEKGKNKAIAEWPTKGGQLADYILFAGLTPIAVVEAKKKNENVAGKIGQAERYSRGFKNDLSFTPAWELEGRTIAWPDGDESHFHIPFAFSCNGRPFNKNLPEQSGTWFRDLRHHSNIKRPLQDFCSPEGLLDRLKRSKEAAEQKLKKEGFSYLNLRDYQQLAIQAVESALEQGQTNCLFAMATGTGKTRTIIGLMYRLLKSERFRRILFLVDRTSLGDQAIDVFNEAPLEQNQSLSKIYNIAELGDMAPEAETRIQVATVQAMVHRIFKSETPLTIDEYDCIIVDEAHRGYTLDQEMTEGEIILRETAQYLSSYRRVLDYFDAVKIGMTATPAKHTTEIFGKPVYTYSYREAVADDWLIDHEPPIRYETLLSRRGIKFEKGEKVNAVNINTGEIEMAELEDDMDFEVSAFNRSVITPEFNKVICEQLAKELDPFGEEKAIIFCATDRHADMVKRMLDDAFLELYGEDYNEASVRKITGKSDKVDTLIRKYKLADKPSIAITVDLLTTGIDVPKICHLVFMRRVRSRILYEQMIGRATRRCDDIGKTVFKIYDTVDIYSALEKVSTMKPLVKDPNVTIDQLIDELQNPESYTSPGSIENTTHADDVLNALSQKFMRVLRKANKKAESNSSLSDKLDELHEDWGVKPEELHKHLQNLGPKGALDFINQHAQILNQLADVNKLLGTYRYPILSEEEDKLQIREQSFGDYEKPEDYIESFEKFIKENVNLSVALSVVVNRPKDLTREQLKEIKMLLDEQGYNVAKLSTAWRSQTNQEIAASIIGFIRRAALGTELIPFEDRVKKAMTQIYALHNWTQVQRKWLDRLAKQLNHEIVIDQEFVNRAFAGDGGSKRLNKLLDNELDDILKTLAESLWNEAG